MYLKNSLIKNVSNYKNEIRIVLQFEQMQKELLRETKNAVSIQKFQRNNKKNIGRI